MVKEKSIARRLTLIFTAFNLGAFLLFFLFNYVEGIADSDFGIFCAFYVLPFILRGIEVLCPLAIGSAATVIYLCRGGRSAFLSSLLFCATRIIYFFPYYYLYFISERFDSADACLFSAGVSLLAVAALYGISLLAFLIIYKSGKRKGLISADGEKINGILNLDAPLTFGIFTISLLGAGYLFVKEIIEAAIFLYETGFFISIGELGFIIISMLIDIAFLLVFHFLLCFASAALLKKIGKTG